MAAVWIAGGTQADYNQGYSLLVWDAWLHRYESLPHLPFILWLLSPLLPREAKALLRLTSCLITSECCKHNAN